MKITGIITEYNPFHNGHLYHLKKAKELTNSDLVVCITSGYFTMRGDVSVLTKKEKAKLAINYGCDLVIELPYLLGTQNADIFAYNAVKILNELKVDEIVSGSESNDLSLIDKVFKLEHKEAFQNLIKTKIDQGLGLRKAFSDALKENGINDFLSNDLLNLKYYEAILKINPKIKLTLIKRINNNYHDETYNNTNIQSATAIRSKKDLKNVVPLEVQEILDERGFMDLNSFSEIFKHLAFITDFKTIFEMKEGLDQAFKKDFIDLNDLINKLTTKRYTKSRIKRLITYVLTNTTKLLEFRKTTPIRVLGFNQEGQKYLNKIKKDVLLLVTIKEGIDPIYDKEITLAKIFTNVFKIDFLKMEQTLPYIKK